MFAPLATLSVSAPAPWWMSSPSVCLVLMESFCRCFVALTQNTAFPKPSSLVHNAVLAPGFPYDTADTGLLQALLHKITLNSIIPVNACPLNT